MSFKQRQRIRIAQEHEFYESPSGNMEAWSGERDDIGPTGYQAAFPGPRENRTVDAQNYVMSPTNLVAPNIRDYVEWDIGGIPGQTKFVGSTGVTDPQTVDAHNFEGQMQVVRRMPDTNYGPTSGSDHNSILSLLYAMQESNAYFPNEVSQVDVIRSV